MLRSRPQKHVESRPHKCIEEPTSKTCWEQGAEQLLRGLIGLGEQGSIE